MASDKEIDDAIAKTVVRATALACSSILYSGSTFASGEKRRETILKTSREFEEYLNEYLNEVYA